MEQRRLQIPSGMQDTLPGECARKRQLEEQLRHLFTLQGYQEVETPILEYYDALDDRTWGYRPEDVWKTFDGAGRILAVRPDSTIPAARMAAGRLAGAALPLRLCYLQSATKTLTDTSSLLCEETQCGVELMGEASPEADAEVIALAVRALVNAGLKDFQMELGQAQFVAGFLQEAGLTEEQSAVIRGMIERKNALDMQMYLDKLAISADVAARLMQLPRLYGDLSVLDEAERLTRHPLCLSAIGNLRQILAILAEYGCADCVSIDLGMAPQANYYSGAIFRGLVAELGQPLLSGGRYDELPARFGRALPATGFALSMKLLLIALERQGAKFDAPVPDVALAFEPGCRLAAIAYAGQMREKGVSVAMMYGASAESLRHRVDQQLAQSAVYITAQGIQQYGKAVF
ncbi:MAG: ATP phosphoribosyltransferase regulatory subunit [Clostridia bacterium]|nr:ATP phosphoribosyltransferase regulatory subunit [Clostridia bacterium]